MAMNAGATTSTRTLAIARELRTRVLSGSLVFGPWTGVPHPSIIEVMARLDYAFLLLDGEHSPITSNTMSLLLPAAELHGRASVFRAPSHEVTAIKEALDTGVSGVMVPMVETAEQARAIVANCRYAPLGSRGIGPWRASGFYEDFSEYLAQANEAVTVVLQLESAQGLENLDEIVKVEGFDVLYVGPADLSSSLGIAVGSWNADLIDVLRRVATAARGAGKIAGIDLPSLERLPLLLDVGFTFFTYGSDLGFLQSAGGAAIADIQSFVSERKNSKHSV